MLWFMAVMAKTFDVTYEKQMLNFQFLNALVVLGCIHAPAVPTPLALPYHLGCFLSPGFKWVGKNLFTCMASSTSTLRTYSVVERIIEKCSGYVMLDDHSEKKEQERIKAAQDCTWTAPSVTTYDLSKYIEEHSADNVQVRWQGIPDSQAHSITSASLFSSMSLCCTSHWTSRRTRSGRHELLA